MVPGDNVCDIPQTGGKLFIHSTTNRIILIKIYPGTLLNERVLHMDLTRYLITMICSSIYGKCSAVVVVLRFDLPGIIIMKFSNFLYIHNVSTYIPRL